MADAKISDDAKSIKDANLEKRKIRFNRKRLREFERNVLVFCKKQELTVLAYYGDYTGCVLGIGEYCNDLSHEVFMVQIDIVFDDEKFRIEEEDKKESDAMKYIPEEIDSFLKTNCYGKKFEMSELVDMIQRIFVFVKKERGYEYVMKKC